MKALDATKGKVPLITHFQHGRFHFRRSLFYVAVLMLFVIPVLGATAIEESPVTLKIVSAAFTEGGAIPQKYTCEGDDISPPLAWSGVPQGAKSLVLILDDPDAPDPSAPKMTWVHWVLYNLPPSSKGIGEGVEAGALPPGSISGLNDWKREGYGGPCPPIGRHRYVHKLMHLIPFSPACTGLQWQPWKRP